MHETATLHFDLSHLAPDQLFTLHVGSSRYDLAPHSRQTLARARRSNSALRLMRDDRVTHFTGPVQLPGNAPVLEAYSLLACHSRCRRSGTWG